MRKVRVAFGLLALVLGLSMAVRTSFLAGAHDYVLTLASAVAAAASLRAAIDLLAAETAE